METLNDKSLIKTQCLIAGEWVDGDNKADYKLRVLQGVSSADTHHSANAMLLGPEHIEVKDVEVTAELGDRPWGWRSFVARDPNGVYLDFFHVLEQAQAVNATG